MNKMVIRERVLNKNLVRGGISDLFNFMGVMNDAVQFSINVVGTIQWFIDQVDKTDKVMDRLKSNSEYMNEIYNKIDEINNKTIYIINLGELTGGELKKIKDAQVIQAGMLNNIGQELADVNSLIKESFVIIKKNVSMLGVESLQIKKSVDNILNNLIIVNEMIARVKNDVELNTLSIQLGLPYQNLIYARERFNILSANVFDDDKENEEIPVCLSDFSNVMAGYGNDGLIYNITFILNELKGNNFTKTKAADGIISVCINKLKALTAPQIISPVCWISSQYGALLNIVTQSLSIAGMCYSILNKNFPKKVLDSISEEMKTEVNYFSKKLKILLDSGYISNPGLISSLYTEQWIKFELDSNITSKSGVFSLKADDGHAIVGFEFIREDKNRVLTKIYQAKVLPYYCIEDSTEGAVTTKSVDLTGLLLGSDSWPHGSICNNDVDNHRFLMNKHRKFNDGFLITQIDFTGTEPSPVRFNYEVYASKYDVETGTLSTDKTVANDSNSSNVTALVRKIADVFYEKTEKVAGLPVTKLVDAQLSPLNGFYLFIQGGGDIDVDPLVTMTDVTLYKQVDYFKNDDD